MEFCPQPSTNFIESLSAERQREIFATGAPLTEYIGNCWINHQRLYDETNKTFVELRECFEMLASYCQLAYLQANKDEGSNRIQAFTRGTAMGIGIGWRILSDRNIHVSTPVVLEMFDITIAESSSLIDDESPEADQQAARQFICYFDQQLETQHLLNLKLELLTAPYTDLNEELFTWFKRGVVFSYPYMLSAYQNVLFARIPISPPPSRRLLLDAENTSAPLTSLNPDDDRQDY